MKTHTPQIDTEKAVHISLGAASPLWFLYAGAGAAGAAFYWMNRWREATNLEALLSLMSGQAEIASSVAAATVEIAEEAAETVAETVVDPIVEAMPAVEEVVAVLMPEPVAEAAPETEPEPDDLTILVGIGPKLAASLAERGITRFADVAALTPKKIARLDAEMKLMGRIERDAWVAQAKRFAEA